MLVGLVDSIGCTPSLRNYCTKVAPSLHGEEEWLHVAPWRYPMTAERGAVNYRPNDVKTMTMPKAKP